MKRSSLMTLLVVVILGMFPLAALAANGHFITGGANAPECIEGTLTVTCTGKVAGLGGDTFEIRVVADGIAEIECENPGGKVAPGQDKVISLDGTTGEQTTPKNGQFNFGVETNPPGPFPPGKPTCPNDKWIPHVVNVNFTSITLLLLEDGVPVDQYVVK